MRIEGVKMKSIVSSLGIAFRGIVTKSSTIENKPTRSSSRAARKKKIKWTDRQSQILSSISKGESVFITGSAGSGKTMLVKEIIKLLKKIHGRSAVFITASTGVAACALSGQTLHSFAGVGLATADREVLFSRVCKDKEALKRWKNAKALVIDEISMVDANLFDNLEFLARKLRSKFSDERWGGLQLVVSGDFFQLPPIIDSQDSLSMKEFAFEADCWNSSFDLQVELSTVFRQSEPPLIRLLQGIRRGKCDFEDFKLLKQRCSNTEPEASVIRLYPRNEDVKRVNEKRLSSLEGKLVVYHALDSGDDPWKGQLHQGITPTCLNIRIGARVMLTKNVNINRKLVNGAAGTVSNFFVTKDGAVRDLCSDNGCGLLPIVRFDSGREWVVEPEMWIVMEGDKVCARRMQIPLVLAWALSIHKCQGMTLDRLHTNLSRAFDYGMVYVALSRVRSLEGLHLSGFKPRKIRAHPKVLRFYEDHFE
ncbi:hypothetical protein Nepgr_023356 [Nepenthes gracilis]|uniref:ATP-dependent DNA helicase n=1 Tax=Nepenthes gracilis TaxID=150966 RepID=A0AAD3T2W5_NEPGR|nr:hypothetical protein Nepgr_023356 [Nepenthes gracilis]